MNSLETPRLSWLRHLVVALALVGIAVGAWVVRRTPHVRPTSSAPAVPHMPAGTSAVPERAGEFRLPEVPVGVEASPAEVAEAMDRTAIRGLLTRLKVAAATDDRREETSTLAVLRRQGKAARQIIMTELQKNPVPKVRAALEEALAQAR